MNLIFEPYLHHFVIVFFEDTLVYSHAWDEHLQNLDMVFQRLLDHELYLMQSKCFIAQTSIEYLGHIVSIECVGPDLAKISAMLHWPAPIKIK